MLPHDVLGNWHEAPGLADEAQIGLRVGAVGDVDRLGLVGEAPRLAHDHGRAVLLGEGEGRLHHGEALGGRRGLHHGHFDHRSDRTGVLVVL